MNGLHKVFYTVKEELFNEQSSVINEWFHSELKKLDNYNIPYDIFIGYYDYDGFNIDRQINDNSIGGVDIDDGFDFVDYLIDYSDNLDYMAVCQLQVRLDIENVNLDNLQNDSVLKEIVTTGVIFIEYNGYELFYDTY